MIASKQDSAAKRSQRDRRLSTFHTLCKNYAKFWEL